MHKQIKLLALGLIYSLMSNNFIFAADINDIEADETFSSSPSSPPRYEENPEFIKVTPEEAIKFDIARERKANADFAEARAEAQESLNRQAREGLFEHITRPETLVNIGVALLPYGVKILHQYLLEEGPNKQVTRINEINVELAEITLQQKKDELEAQQLILKQKAMALYKQEITLQQQDAENQERTLATEKEKERHLYGKFASTYAEKQAAGQELTSEENKHYALCLKLLGISSSETSDDDQGEHEADNITTLKEATVAATAA